MIPDVAGMFLTGAHYSNTMSTDQKGMIAIMLFVFLRAMRSHKKKNEINGKGQRIDSSAAEKPSETCSTEEDNYRKRVARLYMKVAWASRTKTCSMVDCLLDASHTHSKWYSGTVLAISCGKTIARMYVDEYKIIGISITDPDGTVISDDSLAEPDVLIAAENWIVWILTKITKSDISIMYQAKLRSKANDE